MWKIHVVPLRPTMCKASIDRELDRNHQMCEWRTAVCRQNPVVQKVFGYILSLSLFIKVDVATQRGNRRRARLPMPAFCWPIITRGRRLESNNDDLLQPWGFSFNDGFFFLILPTDCKGLCWQSPINRSSIFDSTFGNLVCFRLQRLRVAIGVADTRPPACLIIP